MLIVPPAPECIVEPIEGLGTARANIEVADLIDQPELRPAAPMNGSPCL